MEAHEAMAWADKLLASASLSVGDYAQARGVKVATAHRRLLSREEVCEMLGVSRASFYRLGLPAVKLLDNTVRYDLRDVERLVQARKGVPNAQTQG